eukprot:INCI6154.4.p1 GENE.INCI6154.4~~INCI6154.4.p1  ORF type:complete len:3237 (-),score=530.12 INCI6154.4:2200-11910(-)
MATKETKAARLLGASSEAKVVSSGAASSKAESKVSGQDDGKEERRKQDIEADLRARVAKLEAEAAAGADPEAKTQSCAKNDDSAAGMSHDVRTEVQEPLTTDSNGLGIDEKNEARTPEENSAGTSAASTRDNPAASTTKMTLYEKQQKALGEAKRSFLSAAMRRNLCQRVVASLFSKPSPPMPLGNMTADLLADSTAHVHQACFFTSTVPARCFRDLEVLVLDGTGRSIVVSIGNNFPAAASVAETEDSIRLGDELCEIDGIPLEPLSRQEVAALAARVGRGTRTVKIKRRFSGRSSAIRGVDSNKADSSEAKSVDVIWNFAFQHLIDDLLAHSVALVFPTQRIPDLELHERAKASVKGFHLACKRVNILVAAFAAAARRVVQLSLPQLRHVPAGQRVRTGTGTQSFVVCALGEVAELSALGAQAASQSTDGFCFRQSGAAAAEELRGSIRMCEALIFCAIHQQLKMLHARHSASSPKGSGKNATGDPRRALCLRLPLQCMVRVQGLAFGVEALSIEGDAHSSAHGPSSYFGFVDNPNVNSWGAHNRASTKDVEHATAVFKALYSGCLNESAVEESLGFLLDFDGEANPMPRVTLPEDTFKADSRFFTTTGASALHGDLISDPCGLVTESLHRFSQDFPTLGCASGDEQGCYEASSTLRQAAEAAVTARNALRAQEAKLLQTLPAPSHPSVKEAQEQSHNSRHLFGAKTWGTFNSTHSGRLYASKSTLPALLPGRGRGGGAFPQMAADAGWVHFADLAACQSFSKDNNDPEAQKATLCHLSCVVSGVDVDNLEGTTNSQSEDGSSRGRDEAVLRDQLRQALNASQIEYVRQLGLQAEVEAAVRVSPGTACDNQARLSARFVLCNFMVSIVDRRLNDAGPGKLVCVPMASDGNTASHADAAQQQACRQWAMSQLTRNFEYHPCVADMVAGNASTWVIYRRFAGDEPLESQNRNLAAEMLLQQRKGPPCGDKLGASADDMHGSVSSGTANDSGVYGSAVLLSLAEPQRMCQSLGAFLAQNDLLVGAYSAKNRSPGQQSVTSRLQEQVLNSHDGNSSGADASSPWLKEPQTSLGHSSDLHDSLVQPSPAATNVARGLVQLHSARAADAANGCLRRAAAQLLTAIVSLSRRSTRAKTPYHRGFEEVMQDCGSTAVTHAPGEFGNKSSSRKTGSVDSEKFQSAIGLRMLPAVDVDALVQAQLAYSKTLAEHTSNVRQSAKRERAINTIDDQSGSESGTESQDEDEVEVTRQGLRHRIATRAWQRHTASQSYLIEVVRSAGLHRRGELGRLRAYILSADCAEVVSSEVSPSTFGDDAVEVDHDDDDDGHGTNAMDGARSTEVRRCVVRPGFVRVRTGTLLQLNTLGFAGLSNLTQERGPVRSPGGVRNRKRLAKSSSGRKTPQSPSPLTSGAAGSCTAKGLSRALDPAHRQLLQYAADVVLTEMLASCVAQTASRAASIRLSSKHSKNNGNQPSVSNIERRAADEELQFRHTATQKVAALFAPLTFFDAKSCQVCVDARQTVAAQTFAISPSSSTQLHASESPAFWSFRVKPMLLHEFGPSALTQDEAADASYNILCSLCRSEFHSQNGTVKGEQTRTASTVVDVVRRACALIGLPAPGIRSRDESDPSTVPAAGGKDGAGFLGSGDVALPMPSPSSFQLSLDPVALLLHIRLRDSLHCAFAAREARYQEEQRDSRNKIEAQELEARAAGLLRSHFLRHAQMKALFWLDMYALRASLLGHEDNQAGQAAVQHVRVLLDQPRPPVRQTVTLQADRVRQIVEAHARMQRGNATTFLQQCLEPLGVSLPVGESEDSTSNLLRRTLPLSGVLMLKELIGLDINAEDRFGALCDIPRGPACFQTRAPGAQRRTQAERQNRLRLFRLFAEALESRNCHSVDHPLAAFASALVVAMEIPSQRNLVQQYINEELTLSALAPSSVTRENDGRLTMHVVSDWITTAAGATAALERAYGSLSNSAGNDSAEDHAAADIVALDTEVRRPTEPMHFWEQLCFVQQLQAQLHLFADWYSSSGTGMRRHVRGDAGANAQDLVRTTHSLWAAAPRDLRSGCAGYLHASFLSALELAFNGSDNADDARARQDRLVAMMRSFVSAVGGYSPVIGFGSPPPEVVAPVILEFGADKLFDINAWRERLWHLFRIQQGAVQDSGQSGARETHNRTRKSDHSTTSGLASMSESEADTTARDGRLRATETAASMLKKCLFFLEQADPAVKLLVAAASKGSLSNTGAHEQAHGDGHARPAVTTLNSKNVFMFIDLHRVLTKLASCFFDLKRFSVAATHFRAALHILKLLRGKNVSLEAASNGTGDVCLNSLLALHRCCVLSGDIDNGVQVLQDAQIYVENNPDLRFDHVLLASVYYTQARTVARVCLSTLREAGIRNSLVEIQPHRLRSVDGSDSRGMENLKQLLQTLVSVTESFNGIEDADKYLLPGHPTAEQHEQSLEEDGPTSNIMVRSESPFGSTKSSGVATSSKATQDIQRQKEVESELDGVLKKLAELKASSTEQIEELKAKFVTVKQDKKKAEADGNKKAAKAAKSQLKILTKERDAAKNEYAVAKKQLQKRQKKLEKQLRKKATLAALEVAKDILGGDADPGKTEERQQNFRTHLDNAYRLAMPPTFPGLIRVHLVAALLAGVLQERDVHARHLAEVMAGLRRVQSFDDYFAIKYAAVEAVVSRNLRGQNFDAAVETLETFLMELGNNVTDRNFWCLVLLQRRLGDVFVMTASTSSDAEKKKKIERARECFSHAARTAKQFLGPKHVETMRSELAKAKILADSELEGSSDREQALATAQHELELLLRRARAAHGQFAAVVVSILCELGHVTRLRGDVDAAIRYYGEAHVVFQNRGGGEGDASDHEDAGGTNAASSDAGDSAASLFTVSSQVMEALPRLAEIRLQRGQLAEALMLFNDLLEIQERVIGSSSPGYAATLLAIGRAQVSHGNATRGHQILGDALGVYEEVYGEDSVRAVSIREEIKRAGGVPPQPRKPNAVHNSLHSVETNSRGEIANNDRAQTEVLSHVDRQESSASTQKQGNISSQRRRAKKARRVLVDDDDSAEEDAISAALNIERDRSKERSSQRQQISRSGAEVESKQRHNSSHSKSPSGRHARGSALRALGTSSISTHSPTRWSGADGGNAARSPVHAVREAHADTGQASRLSAHMIMGQTGSMSEGRRLAARESKHRDSPRSESKSPSRHAYEGKQSSLHRRRRRTQRVENDTSSTSDNDDLYDF